MIENLTTERTEVCTEYTGTSFEEKTSVTSVIPFFVGFVVKLPTLFLSTPPA
jgi:hypothetical protein